MAKGGITMLSTITFNSLKKATVFLKEYIGKRFFSKKYNCEVEIINYTLSGQLIYRSDDFKHYDTIWHDEYNERAQQ